MPQNKATTENGKTAGSRVVRDVHFAGDVQAGLCQSPKRLSCVYFYDHAGSMIFEQICRQPEYYCTRAEMEILKMYSSEIASLCSKPERIVELGSGSSVKTRILIEAFIDSENPISYYPIDISEEILIQSAKKLKQNYPLLKPHPIVASYEEGLGRLDSTEGTTLLIWLGSSIGNYEPKSAAAFLQQICNRLSNGDRILIGIDLIKDPQILEAAYNDSAGITASFNLNLLARINRELGGNFRLEHFSHRAVFNPEEGRIEMYLVSNCEQTVYIEALDVTVSFSNRESIHTENSYKYGFDGIEALAHNSGMTLLHQWFDSKEQFSLNLFETGKQRGTDTHGGQVVVQKSSGE